MIAAGRYDWNDSGITTRRFPISGNGIIEFDARYFHFDCTIFSSDVVSGIKSEDAKNSWMPAKIEHALAHGKTFPNEQLKFPIIAFGLAAKVGGRIHAPCLSRDGKERIFCLVQRNELWHSDCRFLAVREVSGT